MAAAAAAALSLAACGDRGENADLEAEAVETETSAPVGTAGETGAETATETAAGTADAEAGESEAAADEIEMAEAETASVSEPRGIGAADPAKRFAGVCTSLLEQSIQSCDCIYGELSEDEAAYLSAAYSGDMESAAEIGVRLGADPRAIALESFNAAQADCAAR